MKLKYILGIGCLTVTSVANAQVGNWRSDTLSVGTGYAEDAYFHLENGQVKSESNNNWDLAFPGGVASMMSHTVIINDYGNGKSGKLMELTGKTAADFGTNLTADTAGKAALRNIPTTWEEGAFGLAMGGTNPSWGTYNSGTHYIDGAKLYAYVVGGVGYQIYIEQFQASATLTNRKWIFKVAKLDGTDQGTYELMPADYANKHLMYFNLATRTAVDRDPNYADWQLLATKYGDNYGSTSGAIMSTTGIVTSPNVEVAKAVNLVPNDADYNNFETSYSEDKNVIGGTYKVVDYAGTPPGWVVYDSLSYFVKNKLSGDADSGDIYQVYFDYFPASTSGDVKIGIQIRKVFDHIIDTGTSVKYVNKSINNLILAPNPSVGGASNILIDANTNLGKSAISITDINGRIINTFDKEIGAGLTQLRLDVSSYQAGMYFVTIANASGRQTVKLIVQ